MELLIGACYLLIAISAVLMGCASLKFLIMPIGHPTGHPTQAACPRCNAQSSQPCNEKNAAVLPHAERYAVWLRGVRDGVSLSSTRK